MSTASHQSRQDLPRLSLEGSEVSLNGSATDPEGDALTYLWTHNSTIPDIALVNATSASTTFTAPQVDSDTAIIFTLTADDGQDTSSDSVSITVTAHVNGLPSVEAGPAQTVLEGSEVSLNGATDPEGDALTYLWTHNSTDLNSYLPMPPLHLPHLLPLRSTLTLPSSLR